MDLGYNKIASLPQGFTFTGFPRLRTLLLHYNRFLSLKALAPLTEVPLPLSLGQGAPLLDSLWQPPGRAQGEAPLCELTALAAADGRQNRVPVLTAQRPEPGPG